MASIRQQLIDKIKTDLKDEFLYFDITIDRPFYRPTLTWQQKTVGRLIWYWLEGSYMIGSSENIKDLLKAEKLVIYQHCFGIQEISSS
jgi:hypothetical protein